MCCQSLELILALLYFMFSPVKNIFRIKPFGPLTLSYSHFFLEIPHYDLIHHNASVKLLFEEYSEYVGHSVYILSHLIFYTFSWIFLFITGFILKQK